MAATLREQQLDLARYLRNPQANPAPEGIEQRRLDVYDNLVFSNIEGFLRGGFPVLRSLYDEEQWRELVRCFIETHRCQSPFFLEISQEFLQFLMQEYTPRDCDPPFMAELAHYEWVELALDVSSETIPVAVPVDDLMASVPRLSPVAWLLSYSFPVHQIGPGFRPTEAAQPTYLAVYRDREDTVRFMELNPASARLLELARDNQDSSCLEILQQLAAELGADPAAISDFGAGQLRQFAEASVICLDKP